MNAQRLRRHLSLLFIMLLTSTLAARQLPNDSRIKSGKLDNGVTWMYRQHDNPPGKMALMLHVDTGSLNETDAQKGLAHFIEHMCFNGSEHFPPGDLIPYFESVGMEFGADLNAFTSFDQTSYMLFLPDAEIPQLDKALTVMSDYAFRVSFIDEEIEKERGVVLEESRTGKNAFQRIRDKLWPELFEGTRFAVRLPIGDDDIIAKAPRQEFVDYYRTWYRPENMTLILVGDAQPEPYLPLIEKWFGQYKPTAPGRKAKGPEFKSFQEQRAMVVTDPEMAFCSVDMTNIRPGRPPVTTAEQWRTELVDSIGSWIMGRRYEQRVQEGIASYRDAATFVGSFFNDALFIDGSAEGEPEDWAKMLEEVIYEVHRAQEYGFSVRELELAQKELMADAEHAVKTEPTLNARSLLFGMLSSVNEHEPVLSARQELDLYKEFLPTIELKEVNGAFSKHFEPGTFAYYVQMVEKDGVTIPSRDDVLAAAKAAWSRTVEPFKEQETPTQLLASAPTPGQIMEKTVEPDLQITSAWLSNGVRVHHRYMDYKKDTVIVSVSLAGGPIEESPENAGISEVASLAVNEAATSRLTSTNVRDIMTGKNISVDANASGDSLSLSINGSPQDLESGLELAHALLTDGIIEESAFKNWKLQSLQRLQMLSTIPQFEAYKALIELISGSDPRITFMTKEKVEAQSIQAAQKWFDRMRREAPIEVAVVGDIQLDKAMPLIQKYIGSLPSRDRSTKHLDKLRKLSRATGPLSKHIEVQTVNPQAMVMTGFISCEGRNLQDRRAFDLASEVVTSRLVKRIREDFSLVYSIRAQFQPSWIYSDSGTFAVGAPCDPANVDRVVEEVTKILDEFAEQGPTEEELANAKKQVLNNLDTEMREPSYWHRVLAHHDLHGRDLSQEKIEKQAYDPFTVDDVRAVFRKYSTLERRLQIVAVPAGAAETKTEGKTAAPTPG